MTGGGGGSLVLSFPHRVPEPYYHLTTTSVYACVCGGGSAYQSSYGPIFAVVEHMEVFSFQVADDGCQDDYGDPYHEQSVVRRTKD